MRRWGIVVSLFYAFVVLILLVPAGWWIAGGNSPWEADFYRNVWQLYTSWLVGLSAAMVIAGQAILLFLSVDTSQKRPKARGPLITSCITAGMLFALLTFGGFLSLAVAVKSDSVDKFLESAVAATEFLAVAWIPWGIVFYLYLRRSNEVVTRAVKWLLRGSVLELLIAVPCHVIVRRREDCSAPLATSFGITTGIAIMLLSFGPSVLLLYKKRLDAYAARGAGESAKL